jgi:hypothetical protein
MFYAIIKTISSFYYNAKTKCSNIYNNFFSDSKIQINPQKDSQSSQSSQSSNKDSTNNPSKITNTEKNVNESKKYNEEFDLHLQQLNSNKKPNLSLKKKRTPPFANKKLGT